MKLKEKTVEHNESEELKCPNCGGELKHRTQAPCGFMRSSNGDTMPCIEAVDDYECSSCHKIWEEE